MRSTEMNHLDVVATDSGKIGLETLVPRELPNEETDHARSVLDNACSRMLRSIQDSLGFGAAEDAILKWLEGCTLEGVERLSIVLDDYLQNRKEAETSPEQL